jgi:hypothetical protein
MTVRFACPHCSQPVGIAKAFAGRPVRCPHCSNVITTPAAQGSVAAPAPAANAFDFDTAPSPFAEADAPAIGDRKGWQQTAGGLKTVWMGTCLQLLSISTVFFAVIVLTAMGANAAGLLKNTQDPTAPAAAGQARETVAERISLIGMSVVGLGAVLGSVLRIVGFGRCLSIPPESEANVLSFLMLVVEIALALGVLAAVLGRFVHPFVPVFGLAAAVASTLLGLILFLFFLHRIGHALESRNLPSGVFRFTVWLLAGIVGIPAAVGGQVLLVYLVNRSEPTAAKGWLILIGFLLMIVVGLILSLTIMVKYLGLFNLTRDEIHRRVGRRS